MEASKEQRIANIINVVDSTGDRIRPRATREVPFNLIDLTGLDGEHRYTSSFGRTYVLFVDGKFAYVHRIA